MTIVVTIMMTTTAMPIIITIMSRRFRAAAGPKLRLFLIC